MFIQNSRSTQSARASEDPRNLSERVGVSEQNWPQHLIVLGKRYPLPIVSLMLLCVSLILWVSGQKMSAQWLLLGIIVLGGVPLIWEMVYQLLHRVLSVDVIAMLAIGGSLWLGEYLAGAIIVLMLSGGKALEAYALRKATRSLTSLAERAPRTAHIWKGEQLVDVPAETIDVGMMVVVKPGEVVPVDGAVIEGSSSISEADITGEPVPVRKTPGMLVFSGSVSLDGMLSVQASKRSEESKYAQIVRLVQEAQEQRAPIHRLADRYSVVFTLVTLLLAGAAWALSGHAVYVLAVLVVATPCPLILATPIAIMSGIDSAARYGIIVKSGATIEQFGEVDVAVFDKTGTLTLGMPRVTTLVVVDAQKLNDAERRLAEDTLLAAAASLEQLSAHILAQAIVDAAQERALSLHPATQVEEVFGKGICGRVPGYPLRTQQAPAIHDVAIGNRTFMRQLMIALPPDLLVEREQRKAQGQIGSFVALDGVVRGMIVLEDVPRADLAQLTAGLKQWGIKQTILLTGDSEEVARQIGQLAHMDRIVARCLPEEKVQVIRELVNSGHRVLMVGDGVNDAPALATATVGLALGTHGLTAAATVADAVLLSTDILRVVTAIHIGCRVMRIARQGIWIGMGLSTLAMVFAAWGYLAPAPGALLQEGIDILVIANALRVSGGSIHLFKK